jgi:Fe-S-cluster containining protein
MENIPIQKLIEEINSLPNLAKKTEPAIKAVFNKLKSRKPKDLDNFVQGLHVDYFSEIDCLSCGNCCRSLGPRITESDIDRLAKAQKIKPSVFIEKYLLVDEDKDFVFKSMPCPFLAADNYCLVYENRPKACREYPHTDRRKFVQILDLSLKNRETCPVVYKISEDITQKYQF